MLEEEKVKVESEKGSGLKSEISVFESSASALRSQPSGFSSPPLTPHFHSSLLLVGLDSMIGSALAREAQSLGIPFSGTSRRAGAQWPLDLAAPPESWTLPENISTAILCAAETNIGACEANPAATRDINTRAVIALADRLAAQGNSITFLSTSRVFPPWMENPAESTIPAPNTEYGRQKLEVENHLRIKYPTAKIIRPAKIISPHLTLFKNWLHLLTANQPIHTFQDLFFSPIALNFVTRTILDIALGTASGVFHISASDAISYHQAGLHFASRRGLDCNLVEMSNAPHPNTPGSAILSCTRTIEFTGFRPLSASENLDAALLQEIP
jgi:dTDP-4-dehydrorhamnose reductase